MFPLLGLFVLKVQFKSSSIILIFMVWTKWTKLINLSLAFQVSQKELKEALRRQWSQLSDKRRLKWISKALELQKDYEVPDHTGPDKTIKKQPEHDSIRLNQNSDPDWTEPTGLS